MWLLLAGRALYTTGVALQAALADRSQLFVTRNQPRSFEAPEVCGSLPEQCLPVLQNCVEQLGSVLQQLATSDCTAAMQGSQQLQVVLGSPVLEAHGNLLAASTAAATSACKLAADPAGATQREGWWWQSKDARSAPAPPGLRNMAQDLMAEDVSQAWQQLDDTGEGGALADGLLSFGSLLCAALPTRLCCNEPSCCCLDKPAEQQLAAGKGSQCSACGAARYCGKADQRKHWKQHKPICQAIAATAKASSASVQQAAAGVSAAAAAAADTRQAHVAEKGDSKKGKKHQQG
jgi:hypothetical protein